MKKQLLLLAMILLPLVASAQDIKVQNADGVTIYYNFINDGKELEITYHRYLSHPCYQGNVVIPEEVTYMNTTYKVTSIGNNAFYRCSGLTSITIPNSITSIGGGAFEKCSGLTSVTIPNSVTIIRGSAFFECSNLTSINIPNSVTSIGDIAFYGCIGLKKVIVPDIAAWCNISFGDNPLYYAHHLYCDENTEITDLVIPNSVTNIGNKAFMDCLHLTSVTIPNSVTSIGSKAFSDCYGLTSVTIGNSVTSIGNYAFDGCSGLTSITIPNSVTSIGESAFSRCYGLTSVTIGNSVTSIGNYAFSHCSGLTYVTIPNSVTSIGEWAFSYCSGLTSVTIPNSVTSIGIYAFYGCSGLTSITIPNSVTSIGYGAFDGVDFPTVVSLIENPFKIIGKASDYRTFSQNTFNNATLYIPKGTIDKYKATDGWKDFLFIEEGVPAGISVVENIEENKAVIYNLNGVRQSGPKKGINIINGKKVVLK